LTLYAKSDPSGRYVGYIAEYINSGNYAKDFPDMAITSVALTSPGGAVLSQAPQPEKKKKGVNMVVLIVIISVCAIAVLVAVALIVILCCVRKRKSQRGAVPYFMMSDDPMMEKLYGANGQASNPLAQHHRL